MDESGRRTAGRSFFGERKGDTGKLPETWEKRGGDCRIEVKKDVKGGYKHYLSDNNSKNHTLYNSNYLENGEIVVLNNNDEIIIGRTVLRFNE